MVQTWQTKAVRSVLQNAVRVLLGSHALASCSTRQYATWLSCTTLVGTTTNDITKYSEAELGGQRLGLQKMQKRGKR